MRKKHARLEANRVQNGGVERSGYINSNEWIKWALTSRDQSLDWYQVINKEIAIYSQDLYYSFNFHALNSFFISLD